MPDPSTREIIAKYFDAIANKGNWQSIISDDMQFKMPSRTTRGKASYIEITGRFLRGVTDAKIREIIIERDKACVIVAYCLRSPKGNTATKEVVEILSVEDGEITSSSIYFDTEDFRTFMAQ